MVDIVLAEAGQVHRGDGSIRHLAGEGGEFLRVLGRDGPAQELVGQGGDVGLVDEAGLAQEPVGDGRGGGGSEHRADVDGHIEQREGGITLGGILRVVVQIAHEDLEVTLEQAGTDGDEGERADHEGDAQAVGRARDGKAEITGEHDGDTGHDAFAVADLVGQPATDHRHEIDGGQEDGIDLAGGSAAPAELGLEEEHEDGQHRVVAEPFSGVGQCQRIKSFVLTFEHIR